MFRARYIVGILIWIIVILVVSQLSTGSLNPMEVYRKGSLTIKIVESGFIVILSFVILQWLRFMVIGPDRVCAGCGKNVWINMEDPPFKCPFCKRFYHMTCYRRGEPGIASMAKGCRQSDCRSSTMF